LDFSIPNNEGIAKIQQNLEELSMAVSPDDIIKMRHKLLLEKADFTILESIQPFKKGKLSKIHKAMLKGKEVVCKVI
jgi:predicted protein tyrosine phosphatase